jgi:hypothetical protein
MTIPDWLFLALSLVVGLIGFGSIMIAHLSASDQGE